nr:hypothetical protein CFP56_09237 [Quercus suber]
MPGYAHSSTGRWDVQTGSNGSLCLAIFYLCFLTEQAVIMMWFYFAANCSRNAIALQAKQPMTGLRDDIRRTEELSSVAQDSIVTARIACNAMQHRSGHTLKFTKTSRTGRDLSFGDHQQSPPDSLFMSTDVVRAESNAVPYQGLDPVAASFLQHLSKHHACNKIKSTHWFVLDAIHDRRRPLAGLGKTSHLCHLLSEIKPKNHGEQGACDIAQSPSHMSGNELTAYVWSRTTSTAQTLQTRSCLSSEGSGTANQASTHATARDKVVNGALPAILHRMTLACPTVSRPADDGKL